MNASIHRLHLRLAIPVIALVALAVAGEPVPAIDDVALASATDAPLAAAYDEACPDEAEAANASEQRSRTAMRLRWALTLPDSSRPLSIGLLP